MAALIKLAKGILKRHAIEARNVVGHSDVAPQRKMDPGELFDWQRLAAAGIGLWFNVTGTDTIEPASDADLAKTEEYKDEIDRLYGFLAQWGRRLAQRVTKSEDDIINMRGRSLRKGIMPFLIDGSEVPDELTKYYQGDIKQKFSEE